jgi:hypothetical protein
MVANVGDFVENVMKNSSEIYGLKFDLEFPVGAFA